MRLELTHDEDGWTVRAEADGWTRTIAAGLGPVALLAEIADVLRRQTGADSSQLLAAAIGQHVCSVCSCLLAFLPDGSESEIGWRWEHADATEAAWCADFRGDRRPVALLASEACAGEPTYPQLGA